MSAITTMTELMNELERVRDLVRQREEEIDKLNGELHDKNVVPRSRYDACNKDWLEAEQKVREVGGAAIKEIELLCDQLAASQARCKELEHGLTENGIDFTVAERPPA